MDDTSSLPPAEKPLSLLEALLPIVAAIVLLGLSMFLFGQEGGHGPHQVAITCAAMVGVFVGWRRGIPADELRYTAQTGIKDSAKMILQLFAVGALLGTWAMSGTLLAMGYYWLLLLTPDRLYLTALLVCAFVGFAICSSWTVASTFGVGFVGIAVQLGLDPAIMAGAVVSGAYFGDKLSPFSDKTQLAAATAGANLREHTRESLWTSIPAFLTTAVIFWMLGEPGDVDPTAVTIVIDDALHISPILLLPLVLVLVLALFRWPPFTTMLFGAFAGGLVAVAIEPERVLDFAKADDLPTWLALIKGVWEAMATGFIAETGVGPIDRFLTKGGMSSMLDTIWLVIAAAAFGGVIERIGALDRIFLPMIRATRSAGILITSVIGTAIVMNVLAANQQVATRLTERLAHDPVRERRIAPVVLSRSMADSASVTSALVPWNACGAYLAAALGVATFDYAPYAFFNFLSPLIAIIFALLGIRMLRLAPNAQSGADAGASPRSGGREA
jgi:NhaC family Na+:H+ antiporter